MKTKMQLIVGFALSFLSISAMAWSEIVELEDAVEIVPKATSFFLGKSLIGSIRTKQCDECKLEKFSITPETRAFDDELEVKLISKVGISRKPDVVVYNIKTKKVTQLIWNKKIVK